jgi:serine/threonine protein phosphatase PrpC
MYQIAANLCCLAPPSTVTYSRNSVQSYSQHAPTNHHLVERTEKDQFVVVGSDGLWDFMSNEEAIAFVSERLVSE